MAVKIAVRRLYDPKDLVLFNGRVYQVVQFNGICTYDIIQYPTADRYFNFVHQDELKPYVNHMKVVN